MQTSHITKENHPPPPSSWTWFGSLLRFNRRPPTPQPPLKPYDGPLDDLLDEENLYRAWSASRRTGTDNINKWVPVAIAVIVFALLVFVKPSNSLLVNQWENWLGIMSGFMVTMLGFLVSGFAIFSSMNRPSMFAVMAKVADRDAPQFSYLKGIFLRLLRVFAEYWFVMVAVLLLQMLTKRDAPLFVIVDLIHNTNTKNTLLIVVSSLSVWVFVYTLMLLQSFIFNIYQFVMACVVCDVGDYEIERSQEQREKV